MDDSCAVCAESLDWVAYGACGHKDVCSTCVARLRFICDDRRCCICKTESDIVFVTKALGDYTKTISDFSQFPSEAREGRVGQYWYHEGTQAFFDDLDHYKMIKEMCRLSCSVCDRMEDQLDDVSRRRAKFKNIEQLKGHLFHKHKLIMCSLCLEGRKVFICEQKLYTRSQLTQHINTGDSEVDGTESDRGGFMGHPTCEFCLTPFYGDNELYTHMSTEHYTCHICQRQHPGQYEYYKNYDDLEIHFGRDHFLCEDEGCLAKKFIVFQSEAELKRHNTLEHGGRMSRSKRSAALQIPTSFRYRRSSEQDNRRGRGRMFRRDQTDDELSFAIEASLEASSATTSNTRTRNVADHGDETDIEALFPPLESLSTSDSELSSKYREAVSQSSRTLGESSFPPLSGPSGGIPQNSHPDVLPRKTMAAHLRPSNRNTKASSSGPSWPVASRTPAQPAPSRSPSQPAAGWTPAQSVASWTPPQMAANRTSAQPATSRIPTQPAISPSQDWPSINGVSGLSRPRTDVGSASLNHPSSAQSRLPSAINSSFAGSLLSSRTSGSMSRISHSSSAPNLSEHGALDSSETNFPPVSTSKTPKSVAIVKSAVEVKDVHTANKSLVEQMRASLGFDEEKFNAFKEISGEYRQGSMDAIAYLDYVEQFGLSHLVLELAKLLPNAEKQRELIEAHNVMMRHDDPVDNNWGKGIRVKETKGSKKGKGKLVDSSGNNRSKDNLAENVINTVKELQSSYRYTDQEVEVLSKGEYRTDGGKSKAVVYDAHVDVSTKPRNQINSSSASGEVNQNSGNGNRKNKQQKKTSKFHRVRLGDGSIEALLDIKHTDSEPDPSPSLNEGESLPVRGVWRNGGGQKLVSLTSRDRKN